MSAVHFCIHGFHEKKLGEEAAEELNLPRYKPCAAFKRPFPCDSLRKHFVLIRGARISTLYDKTPNGTRTFQGSLNVCGHRFRGANGLETAERLKNGFPGHPWLTSFPGNLRRAGTGTTDFPDFTDGERNGQPRACEEAFPCCDLAGGRAARRPCEINHKGLAPAGLTMFIYPLFVWPRNFHAKQN
jgi:hypothetical protein